MFSFKDFITESIGSEEWNKSTLRAHLNDQHEHLKHKHEDIINHFHDKKKVDPIASSDELKIPVGSVKTIWNHLKAKRKESFGTAASKETKGEKLSRQLGQQKTVRKEEVELDEEQIDEVSAELANKVVQARQARLHQMRKEKGDFGAAKTPEYKKELSKVQKSSPIAQKKSTAEIRKKVASMSAADHERESEGYAKDADENRKRGWSNEEVEYTAPLSESIMVYKAFIERTAK